MDASLHWKKLDTILLLVITAAYSVLSFCTLGSTKAPQTFWVSSGTQEQVTIDLGSHQDSFTMIYYGAVSYSNFSVAVSEDGTTWSDEYPA